MKGISDLFFITGKEKSEKNESEGFSGSHPSAESEGFFLGELESASDNEPGSHPTHPAESEGFEPPIQQAV